jgi:hypothetical protein
MLTLLMAYATSGATALAQEGHPIKGSWIGTWGSKALGDDILVVMTWDGKAITGTINPGTDNIQIKSATLVPEGWVFRMEAAGKAGTFSFEGKMENLALHNRSITGTWKGQKESGKFTIARQ